MKDLTSTLASTSIKPPPAATPAVRLLNPINSSTPTSNSQAKPSLWAQPTQPTPVLAGFTSSSPHTTASNVSDNSTLQQFVAANTAKSTGPGLQLNSGGLAASQPFNSLGSSSNNMLQSGNMGSGFPTLQQKTGNMNNTSTTGWSLQSSTPGWSGSPVPQPLDGVTGQQGMAVGLSRNLQQATSHNNTSGGTASNTTTSLTQSDIQDLLG